MEEKGKKGESEDVEDKEEVETKPIDFSKIDKTEWYGKTKSYWDASPASDVGMLGGLGNIGLPDVQGSKKYLNKVFKSPLNPIPRTKCLEVGAGVGRVTEGVLLKKFHTIDIQDQSNVFINRALERLSSFSSTHRLNNHFIVPLQEFLPLEKCYDCIWIQWVIGYLEPQDMIQCLNRMCIALKDNNSSCVIIKENVANKAKFYADEEDNYCIRTSDEWVELFNQSLLYVKSFEQQMNLPKSIFPVYFFLLKPKKEDKEKEKEKEKETVGETEKSIDEAKEKEKKASEVDYVEMGEKKEKTEKKGEEEKKGKKKRKKK